MSLGSGYDSVGRAVASIPEVRSALAKIYLYWTFVYFQTVYWKDENKEKEAGDGVFFQNFVVGLGTADQSALFQRSVAMLLQYLFITSARAVRKTVLVGSFGDTSCKTRQSQMSNLKWNKRLLKRGRWKGTRALPSSSSSAASGGTRRSAARNRWWRSWRRPEIFCRKKYDANNDGRRGHHNVLVPVHNLQHRQGSFSK